MKRMRALLPLLFLLLLSTALRAQTSTTAEQIQLLKVAFLTKKLNLTTEEAQKFWPIYNDFEDKRETAKKKLLENRKKVKSNSTGSDSLSSADLDAIIAYEADFDENDAKLKRDLNSRLKKVLPVRKIALLYVAEEEFKKELLRQVAEADKKSGSDTTQQKKGN
jgi:hypothetical protein